jgi:hypothetical protein
VRVADLQVQLGALRGGAVADADERQALLEALRDPATMFATSARIVPDIASASTESLAGANISLPSSFLT